MAVVEGCPAMIGDYVWHDENENGIQDPATGGEGPIEYLWMYSTEEGAFNQDTWTPIPGLGEFRWVRGALTWRWKTSAVGCIGYVCALGLPTSKR